MVLNGIIIETIILILASSFTRTFEYSLNSTKKSIDIYKYLYNIHFLCLFRSARTSSIDYVSDVNADYVSDVNASDANATLSARPLPS